jgi:two-component system chemotaxis response regulator CheB
MLMLLAGARQMAKRRYGFVAIGASGAQGLRDISQLLNALPKELNAVVTVVLHRPWEKPSNLRAILAAASHMPVFVVSDGESLKPGVVYIGEPSEHLTLFSKSLGEITADPNRDYTNRTVDLLFDSVAKYAGERAIGVVLSGSLDDGARGLAAIHRSGGLTMVLTGTLNESGMPENAASYDGPVDVTGSPVVIAQAILSALL